ncbi:putative PTS transport system IIA component [Staphylococcus arlettae CVD059]|nr:putative PTS transport system IIA component [Staphylococcus arlettae CVD059]
MALEILTSDKVQIKDHVEHWSEAIDIAAQPLLNQRYFDQPYITAMINSVESLGPIL